MNFTRLLSCHPLAAGGSLILFTVSAASFIPLVLSLGHSREFPFLSLAVFGLARFFTSFALSWLLAGGMRRLWIVFRGSSPVVLWYFAGRMENLIFILSIRFISPALSLLISESYPVFCMLLLSRDARARRSGWAPVSLAGVLGVLLALAALALGSLSQWTGAVAGVSYWGFLLGCGMAASICLILSMDSRVLVWSMAAGRRLPDSGEIRSGVVGLALWYGLSSLAVAAVFLLAGLVTGEHFSRPMLLSAGAGGVSGAGAVSWRSGYLLSRRPEFVGLMSFFPILSGLWLSVFGGLAADPRLMFPALFLVCVSGLLACWGHRMPDLRRVYRRVSPWNRMG